MFFTISCNAKTVSNVCSNRPDLERELYSWRKCVLKSCFEGATSSGGLKDKQVFKFEKKFPLVDHPEITYEELMALKEKSSYYMDYNYSKYIEFREAHSISWFTAHPIDFRLDMFKMYRYANPSSQNSYMTYLGGYNTMGGRYGSTVDYYYMKGNYNMYSYEYYYSQASSSNYASKVTKFDLGNAAITHTGYPAVEPSYLDFKYDAWNYIKNWRYLGVCIAKEGRLSKINSSNWVKDDLNCSYS